VAQLVLFLNSVGVPYAMCRERCIGVRSLFNKLFNLSLSESRIAYLLEQLLGSPPLACILCVT